jgi:hypothetical protein
LGFTALYPTYLTVFKERYEEAVAASIGEFKEDYPGVILELE